jgi:hypothetical protein
MVLLWTFVAAVARAEVRPTFSVQGGVVAAALPATILESSSVKKQLASGLTTTFLVVARHRAGVTGARLEVRYDLWDEVWLVRRIEFDGKSERLRLTSHEAMVKWWRTPVRVLATAADRVALQIDLTVLPFSAAEEADARDWMTVGGGGIVDALIGTTISARPITSYRWNVDLSLR